MPSLGNLDIAVPTYFSVCFIQIHFFNDREVYRFFLDIVQKNNSKRPNGPDERLCQLTSATKRYSIQQSQLVFSRDNSATITAQKYFFPELHLKITQNGASTSDAHYLFYGVKHKMAKAQDNYLRSRRRRWITWKLKSSMEHLSFVSMLSLLTILRFTTEDSTAQYRM